MQMNTDPEWLRRMAEREDGGIVSVGGLVTDLERLPVRVFLPLKRNRRGGKFTLERWTVDLPKREDFTAVDLTPFVIQSSCDETDWRDRWAFTVDTINHAGRNATLKPYDIQDSQAYRLITALEALGWKRVREPLLCQS